MLELRAPTQEQLNTAYARDLSVSFPPAELKPLSAITAHLAANRYRPWCLFDGDALLGECFLWLGAPGWALLDYLCIAPPHRNGGLGGVLLEKMRAAEPETVIIAETERPEDAPDPAMARRRIDFYKRNGARFSGFCAQVFGVSYHVLYWAAEPIPDAVIMERYDEIYRRSFLPEKYQRYIQIPWNGGSPAPKVPWDE
jgi:GNAT superfamily N-acetyltransferase